MAHPGHKKKAVGKDPSAKRLGTYQIPKAKPPGRKLSKANVIADLKKFGKEHHEADSALWMVGGPVWGGLKWGAVKTAGKLGIKKLGKKGLTKLKGSKATPPVVQKLLAKIGEPQYKVPRNYPSVIMTGAKTRASSTWSGGKAIQEWNVPPLAGSGMEKWAGVSGYMGKGPRPPGHTNLRPIVVKAPNIPRPGAAKPKKSPPKPSPKKGSPKKPKTKPTLKGRPGAVKSNGKAKGPLFSKPKEAEIAYDFQRQSGHPWSLFKPNPRRN